MANVDVSLAMGYGGAVPQTRTYGGSIPANISLKRQDNGSMGITISHEEEATSDYIGIPQTLTLSLSVSTARALARALLTFGESNIQQLDLTC